MADDLFVEQDLFFPEGHDDDCECSVCELVRVRLIEQMIKRFDAAQVGEEHRFFVDVRGLKKGND